MQNDNTIFRKKNIYPTSEQINPRSGIIQF